MEEKQCGESLILRRGSDMFFNREMRQEFGDLAFAHLVWMALVVKQDKAPYPISVRLLCADRPSSRNPNTGKLPHLQAQLRHAFA